MILCITNKWSEGLESQAKETDHWVKDCLMRSCDFLFVCFSPASSFFDYLILVFSLLSPLVCLPPSASHSHPSFSSAFMINDHSLRNDDRECSACTDGETMIQTKRRIKMKAESETAAAKFTHRKRECLLRRLFHFPFSPDNLSPESGNELRAPRLKAKSEDSLSLLLTSSAGMNHGLEDEKEIAWQTRRRVFFIAEKRLKRRASCSRSSLAAHNSKSRPQGKRG